MRIAAAQAMGNMLAKAQMQIFGDPDTMAAMTQQFMRAAVLGTAADGLLQTLPPEGQELLEKLAFGGDVAVAARRKQATDAGNGATTAAAATEAVVAR